MSFVHWQRDTGLTCRRRAALCCVWRNWRHHDHALPQSASLHHAYVASLAFRHDRWSRVAMTCATQFIDCMNGRKTAGNFIWPVFLPYRRDFRTDV